MIKIPHRKRGYRLILICLFAALLMGCQTIPPNWKTTTRLVRIDTRPSVTLKFILIEPHNPKASVILFAGGHGILRLRSGYSMGWGKGNFLVRTRDMFAKHGYTVAVVDAPSDRRKPISMYHFRSTPEHVADIEKVIKYLKERNALPVWLIGTSRGTISAAHIAQKTQAPIDGLVLTSSMNMVAGLPMFNIKVPSLVVHHKNDKCRHCMPGWAELTYESLSEYSSLSKLKFYEGGLPPISSPCNAKSQHGFYGIESKVIDGICEFINSNL